MAWPKRHTRTLRLDGCDYLWHLSGNQLDCSGTVLTVGKATCRHYLHVDPYPWDFEIRPATVAEAVRWALSQGWSAEDGPTRRMALGEAGFAWHTESSTSG